MPSFSALKALHGGDDGLFAPVVGCLLIRRNPVFVLPCVQLGQQALHALLFEGHFEKTVGRLEGLLLRIDTLALEVLDTWNIAPCGQPSAMDMDKARDTLKNLQRVWRRPVHIETVDDERGRLLSYDGVEHKSTRL